MPKRTNLQRKADRLNRRAGRIEKRKGLGEGEGAKVLANRKQRRKELWQAPPEGQEGFTKKYRGKEKAGEGAGAQFSEFGMAASPTDLSPQQDAKMFAAKSDESAIKTQLNPPTWESRFSDLAKGGGINTTIQTPDLTDMSSNASALYRKKKGY